MSSAQPPPPSGVGAVLGYLGRLPRHGPPLEGLLPRVTDLVHTVLPGSPEASVTLLDRRRPATVVATGALAVDLDEAQYAHGHGPCLHAAATWEVADVPDTRVESRWPDYARRAVAGGTLSSLSVPLVIDDPQVSGALNIYAGRPHAFDQAGRSAAIRIAPFAAVAAGNLSRHRRAAAGGGPGGGAGRAGGDRAGQGHPHGAAQRDRPRRVPPPGPGLAAHPHDGAPPGRAPGAHRRTPLPLGPRPAMARRAAAGVRA